MAGTSRRRADPSGGDLWYRRVTDKLDSKKKRCLLRWRSQKCQSNHILISHYLSHVNFIIVGLYTYVGSLVMVLDLSFRKGEGV